MQNVPSFGLFRNRKRERREWTGTAARMVTRAGRESLEKAEARRPILPWIYGNSTKPIFLWMFRAEMEETEETAAAVAMARTGKRVRTEAPQEEQESVKKPQFPAPPKEAGAEMAATPATEEMAAAEEMAVGAAASS